MDGVGVRVHERDSVMERDALSVCDGVGEGDFASALPPPTLNTTKAGAACALSGIQSHVRPSAVVTQARAAGCPLWGEANTHNACQAWDAIMRDRVGGRATHLQDNV